MSCLWFVLEYVNWYCFNFSNFSFYMYLFKSSSISTKLVYGVTIVVLVTTIQLLVSYMLCYMMCVCLLFYVHVERRFCLGRPCRRSRRVSIQQLRQMQDGEEIYFALRSAADPDTMQVCKLHVQGHIHVYCTSVHVSQWSRNDVLVSQ